MEIDDTKQRHEQQIVRLEEHEIHIYLTDIQCVPPTLLPQYRSIMSKNELNRNRRFRVEKDKLKDCVVRCLTRRVLSRYCNLKATELRFVKGEFGKPEIENSHVPIRFNLSHTARFVACAVTRSNDIGIDIEYIHRNNDVRCIAKHYLTEIETKDIFDLPYDQQESRFFDYWTLKEAYLKAQGVGISGGLDNISFFVNDPKTIAIRFSHASDDAPENWQFWLMSPTEDHRMAVAFRFQPDERQPKITLQLFKTVPLHVEPVPFDTA